MKAKAPRPHRIWLVAGVTTALIAAFVAFEILAANFRLFQEQSQIDASSGKTRRVSKWFGIESEGPVQDTFLSNELAGETIGNTPDWKPMTTYSGGFMFRTHGHSGWDRALAHSRNLEGWWVEYGFTPEARTESARRVLCALKQGEGAMTICHWFLKELETRLREQNKKPAPEQHIETYDLPDLADCPK